MDINANLKGMPLTAFTQVEGGIIYLTSHPLSGFQIVLSKINIDTLATLKLYEMTLGDGGVLVGYYIKVPATTRVYSNMVVIPRRSSSEDLLDSNSSLIAELRGLLIYENENGSLLILSSNFQNEITKNL